MNRPIHHCARALVGLLAATAIFTACDADSGGNGGGRGTNLNGPGVVAAGESCEGHDADTLCIGLKWVTYKNSAGNAVAGRDDATENLRVINNIWKQCGIAFQIETYQEVSPAESGLPYGGAAAEAQTNAAREAYGNDTQFLVVTTGAWGVTKNAWTASPGAPPYGAIMEGSISSGYGEIYAHELGHYLGLDHVGDSSDLMTPIIAHTSTNLDRDQCLNTRAVAQQFWPAMLR
jgi:hypothetical protein